MGPIGVFDSGYGGLTVFKEMVKELPNYDFIYLGDNARVPYGTRSYETVYQYTLECVKKLFDKGCSLVILACNTASAKALRSIQQQDLPLMGGNKRVLGVIRPTTEIIGNYTKTRKIGILATPGTVQSQSYPLEIRRFYPDIEVYQEACPLWVPIVENNLFDHPGTLSFIKSNINNLLNNSREIDTIVLACTHYPLLMPLIKACVPEDLLIVSQSELVSASLKDYLKRHPEMDALCSKGASLSFFTTDDVATFNEQATRFFDGEVSAQHLPVHSS